MLLCLSAACGKTETSIKTDCFMDNSRCIKTSHDNITVSFDAEPNPPRIMNKNRFTVELERGSGALDNADVTLDFSMPGMYMGINRLKMNNAGKGRYEAEWIIPQCPSGGRIWTAGVYIERPDSISQAEFVFEVR
ncbi:MAG: FixH family protein [Nitrospirae bacterium]|nr:FixH family protein [Nitrospirota bacterium]